MAENKLVAPNGDRVPRDVETRETTARPRSWAPAETLPEPEPKEGYVFRWVRTSTLSNADPRNISSALRQGWEPTPISEQPKLQFLLDPNSRFKDNIEIGGLLLCQIPREFMDQRNEYVNNQTKSQLDAVDNSLMRQNDPRMPLFKERRSSTTFGRGS